MPPKKDKKKQEPLVSYDVNTMNTAELKEYAKMLEKEIEANRDFSSFYRQTEDDLGTVLRTRQDHIQQMNEESVNTDIEIEKLISEVQQKSDEKDQRAKYDDFISDKRKTVKESKSRLNESLLMDQYEQEKLSSMLQEEGKKFEAELRRIQMARKEGMEKNSMKLKETMEFEENLRGITSKRLDEKLAETGFRNKLALKSVEEEALEAKRLGENQYHDICQSYKQRLQEYYKGITRNDLDVIKELEQTAEKIKASIESTKLQIKDIQQQNENLKTGKSKGVATSFEAVQPSLEKKISNMTNSNKSKRMESLKKKNLILEGKIKVLEERTSNLRDKFTQILHKVRHSSEMRPLLLEKKLNSSFSNLDDENSKQFSSEDIGSSNEETLNLSLSDLDDEYSNKSVSEKIVNSNEAKLNSYLSDLDDENSKQFSSEKIVSSNEETLNSSLSE